MKQKGVSYFSGRKRKFSPDIYGFLLAPAVARNCSRSYFAMIHCSFTTLYAEREGGGGGGGDENVYSGTSDNGYSEQWITMDRLFARCL